MQVAFLLFDTSNSRPPELLHFPEIAFLRPPFYALLAFLTLVRRNSLYAAMQGGTVLL
jgi:hypothetical protein